MYLNIDDLHKGARAEVLSTLTRGNDEVCLQAIIEAEQEVEAYLSARYEIAEELAKEPPVEIPEPDGDEPQSDEAPLDDLLAFDDGDEPQEPRLPLVVKLVRDLAIWNIYNFTAPVNIPENRTQARDNAIKFLKELQAERASIPGLKRKKTAESGEVSSSYIAFGGNKKRQNHF